MVIYMKDVYGYDAHALGILSAVAGLSVIISNALISPLLIHLNVRWVVFLVNCCRVIGTTGFMVQVFGDVTPLCFFTSFGIMVLTGPTLVMLIGTNVSPESRGMMLAVGGACGALPGILLPTAIGELYTINLHIPLCVAVGISMVCCFIVPFAPFPKKAAPQVQPRRRLDVGISMVCCFIVPFAPFPKKAAPQVQPRRRLDSIVMDVGMGISLNRAPLGTAIRILQFDDDEVSMAYRRLRGTSVEAGVPQRMTVRSGQLINELNKSLLSDFVKGRRQSAS